MKKQHIFLVLFFAALFALAWLLGSRGKTNHIAKLPYAIPFQIGNSEFAPGDSIKLEHVRGTGKTIIPGQTYSVEGTYILSSQDKADLCLFVTSTNPNSGWTPIDSRQRIRITKGTGSFRLVETITEGGFPHVSFYGSHSDFGGVYFGEGESLLRNKGFHPLAGSIGPRSGSKDETPKEISMTGPNKVLFEYLGNPVEAPANLQPAYTKEGLSNAVASAAKLAGISPEKIVVEDSEFPFLVGVICQKGELDKLIRQIKTMRDYEYQGSSSSSTCAAMNIVPWKAYPGNAGSRLHRRVLLRGMMLLDQLQPE